MAVHTTASHPWERCCSAFLRMSKEVAAAFLSLMEEHSNNRNGILKRAAQINGAVIKQMRPISEITA